MAKDGTNRGGARVGAGRKPKALTEKIASGNNGAPIKVLKVQDSPSFVGVDMPPPKEYMKAAQKGGKAMCAEEIYSETWEWLKERGCERFVAPLLIQQYAMSAARWIQCEEAISEYGMLAKHPTTGAPIASPYVTMSGQFSKQTTQLWYQIYSIVKANSSTEYGGDNPQDDLMERLLRARKGV